MTNKYFVRDPDDGEEWADIPKPFDVWSAQDAAEAFAENQCHRDPDYYGRYEEGYTLEVREADTGQVAEVTVWAEPSVVFSSRVKESPETVRPDP